MYVPELLTVCRYEVKFKNGQECGGAYIKLLTKTANFDLVSFQFVCLTSSLLFPVFHWAYTPIMLVS